MIWSALIVSQEDRSREEIFNGDDHKYYLCEKWTVWHDTNVGQRKKSDSPTGMEPITSRTPGDALSTELQENTESNVIGSMINE